MKYCINNTEESFKTFLGILEFDYVSTSTHFKLVDLMGANLNDINKEFFEISESGLINCVDRLWVYIDDYLMNDFIYLYTRQTGFGLSGLDPCTLSYKDCYHLVKRLTDKQDRTF